MADDEVARRREIRRKKILEQSEARLNRITSAKRNHVHEISVCEEKKLSDTVEYAADVSSSTEENLDASEYHSLNNDSDSLFFSKQKSKIGSDKPLDSILYENASSSLNGTHHRSSVADNYVFPKKVSDTETRSFIRSRSDVRRNSTCTQMMMETLQLSSFSVGIFRPWLAALLGIGVQIHFLSTGNFLFIKTILFPFILFETGILTWLHHESQVSSRQAPASFIAGILLLCNFSPHVISTFNFILYHILSCVQDLSIYLFSFTFLHFICENYV